MNAAIFSCIVAEAMITDAFLARIVSDHGDWRGWDLSGVHTNAP